MRLACLGLEEMIHPHPYDRFRSTQRAGLGAGDAACVVVPLCLPWNRQEARRLVALFESEESALAVVCHGAREAAPGGGGVGAGGFSAAARGMGAGGESAGVALPERAETWR